MANTVPQDGQASRLLIAIPHYYGKHAEARHGSHRQQAGQRIGALATCLAALHAVLGRKQVMMEIVNRTAPPANRRVRHALDVVICTAGGDHLLDELPLPRDWYTHLPCKADPQLLGYECHAALHDRLGRYDYYGFMEDDLVVHDALLIEKCAWFSGLAGADAVLQPNRFEFTPNLAIPKVYVDGSIRGDATAPYQDIGDRGEIRLPHLGGEMVFRRPHNPHSGCFFLSDGQMRDFAARPWFLDRSRAFVGPLESAATLGVMRSFRVYKPAPENAGFLEIEHAARMFNGLIGGKYAIVGDG